MLKPGPTTPWRVLAVGAAEAGPSRARETIADAIAKDRRIMNLLGSSGFLEPGYVAGGRLDLREPSGRRVPLRGLVGRQKLHLEALDSRPVDRHHVETQAVPAHLVALLGRTAELAEHEACDRVVVLERHRLGETLVEVVDRERAADPHPAVVDLLDGLVGQVELVLDLAHDLLEHVLQGHDAL